MKTKQLLKNSILACIILCLLALYSTNFNSKATYMLIIGGFVISFIDYILSVSLGMHKLTYSKIVISIISSIFVIYTLQFLTEGFMFSLKIALISAILYSIVSNTLTFQKKEE